MSDVPKILGEGWTKIFEDKYPWDKTKWTETNPTPVDDLLWYLPLPELGDDNE